MELETISLQNFMSENKKEIRESLDLIMKPTFKGLQNPEKYTREVDLLYQLPKTPFPRQARAIVAGYEHLKKNKSLILSAEMGTGKTLMAISMAFLRMKNNPNKQMNFGIMSPTHLTKKWREEILAVLGKKNAEEVEVFIIESGAEMLRLGKQTQRKRIRFYIFSKEVAKLSYRFDAEEKSFLNKKQNGDDLFFVCPTCGTSYDEETVKNNIKKSQAKLKQEREAYLSGRKIKKPMNEAERLEAEGRKNKIALRLTSMGIEHKIPETEEASFCRKCKIQANLIQVKGGLEKYLKGELIMGGGEQGGLSRRVSIAQAIKSFNTKGFFEVLFVDEMHEMKGGDTGQGLAFASLIANSKKAVGLTGTLLNGYVSSLFHILYRMFPRSMLNMGFLHSQESLFVKEFGGYARTDHIEGFDEGRRIGAMTKKTSKPVSIKEIPVINPKLIKFLMPNIIFLKQDELNIPLPNYEERVIECKPDENPKYTRYIETLLSVIKDKSEPNGRKLLGALANDSLSILDLPFRPTRASYEDVMGNKIWISYDPTIPEEYITNKEMKLFELVKSELKEGRKVLLYINFAGLGTGERVKEVLDNLFLKDQESMERIAPRIRILEASVNPKKRSEWIEKNPCEVLITNPELVKTGLDLYDYPTIIYHQTGYVIQTIKQASRRAWRIGQDKTCRVFFLISKSTPQEVAMSLIAKKLKASNDLEGRLLLTQNELTSLAQSGNDSLHEAMLKTISENTKVEVDQEDLEAWVFKPREDDVFEAFFKSRKVVIEIAKLEEKKEELTIKENTLKITELVTQERKQESGASGDVSKEIKKIAVLSTQKENKKTTQKKKEWGSNQPNLFDFFGVEL